MADPATDPVVLKPGALIAGKYELVCCLDSGGMGTVWEAFQAALDQAVAVKFLSSRRANSPVARSRFELEARLAARLGQASPHIVRVLDSGVVTDADGATVPFLVMELLRGRTLAALLEERGQLSLAEASDLVVQLCRALTVTHREGVVHRDLKPSNLFLCRDEERNRDEGLLKLIDFGIAKTHAPQDHSTETGAILGSTGYMSPEQISGTGKIGATTDLWAVAAVTYRMVVGQPPFGSGPVEETASRILCAPTPRASEARPGLRPSFDRWVARGLAKHPADRFATADELGAALAALVDSSDAASAGPPAPLATSRDSESDHTTRHSIPPRNRPRRGPLLLAAGVLGVAVLAGGIFALQRTPPEPATPVPSVSTSAPASKASAPPPPPVPSTPAAPIPPPRVSAPSSAARPPPRSVPRSPLPAPPPKKRARDRWLDTSEF